MGEPVVRWGRSREVLASLRHPESVLTPPWRTRWERLRNSQDRDDFLAARVLIFELLREVGVSTDVRVEQGCAQCGRPGHGQPWVVDSSGQRSEWAISWAHSRGTVAAAAGVTPSLGIDLERALPDALIAPELDVSGRHFVRAEALVKAGAFDLDAGLAANLTWPWGTAGESCGRQVRDLAIGDGLIGALAWGE